MAVEEAQRQTLRDYVTPGHQQFRTQACTHIHGIAITVWLYTLGVSQPTSLGVFRGMRHFEDQ